jgi:arylsulfatase A-like enzyme
MISCRDRVLSTVLACCCLAAGACSGSEPDPAPSAADVPAIGSNPTRGQPPVILISLDTLRADHLGVYGYDRPTTPRLDAFADTATVYFKARATSPWTLPSHASMFTGLYPFEHGCHRYDNSDAPRDPDMEREQIREFNLARMEASALDPSVLTLAEVLSANGYRTGAVIANRAYLNGKYRLDQGFDSYDNRDGRARAINSRALEWIGTNRDDPFFLFLNYMDVHLPYDCSEREGFPNVGTEKDANRVVTGLRKVTIDDDRRQVAARLQRMTWMYDVALANLDQALGELFDELRALDLFDRSLIIVTADHGEFLGEHDLIEHGQDVYEPVLGIPLLVKAPGQTIGSTDSGLISLTHVPGLVLGAVHLPSLPEGVDALASHWPRNEVLAENSMFGKRPPNRVRFQSRHLVRRVLYLDKYKYIESSDGRDELYDLERDPGELDNLIGREEKPAAALLALLNRHWAVTGAVTAPSFPDLSPEELEEMQALGYLGDDGR